MPVCGQTSFNSSPERWTTSVPALGLMQSQSIRSFAGKVPLLSTATPEAARDEAPRSAPIELQHRLAAGDDDESFVAAIAPQTGDMVGEQIGALNLPPPSPSVPTKSVSQKLHCAVARSCSRPDHKLHPAKRRKTARCLDCTPSPWRVRKVSLTA